MEIEKVDKTFYEVKGIRLNPSSLIRLFNILKDADGNMFLNIFKSVKIRDDVLNNVLNIDTVEVLSPWWENISSSYYEDLDSWWIFCMTNTVLNPFEELEKDSTIYALKSYFIPYLHRDMERTFNL